MLWKIGTFPGFCYIVFKYKVWKSWLMTIYEIIKLLKMKLHLKIAWPYIYNYLSFREAIEPLARRINFVEIYETVMIKWLIMLLCCINVHSIKIIAFSNSWGETLHFFLIWEPLSCHECMLLFSEQTKSEIFSTEGWKIISKYCMNKKHRGLCRKSICETDRGCHTPMPIYKTFFRVLG